MRLKHLTTFVAIAGAVAVPAAIAASASASASPTGGAASAFGVSATGLVNIPQTPAVSSLTGPSHKSLIELPPNPLVSLKVLHTSATPGQSRASIVDLKVAKPALSAHLITSKCVGGTGSSHLVKASIAGHRLAVDAAPNSTVAIPVQGLGAVSVVLNKQVHNADGSLTVTAIEVNVGLAGKGQTIAISSATCAAGGGEATPPTTPGPTPSASATPPGEAPVPTPVPSDLPVTG
ncbi:MAG TPA: choice-of-anchor P family protein [Actinoallomurus sp.]